MKKKFNPEDYNKIEMYHGFPYIGTNGLPHFDALGRPKKMTGTVTYRFLKQSVWEKM